MKIGELFMELGFKADNIKLKDFIKSLGELNLSSIISAAGLKGIQEGIEKVLNVSQSVLLPLSHFSKLTGIATKEAQQFANAVNKIGGSKEEALGTLRALQDILLQVSMGENEAAAGAMAMLGITPTQDPIKFFNQLHARLTDPKFMKSWATMMGLPGSNLKEVQATFERMLASQFGITDSVLLYLKTQDEIYYGRQKLSYIDERTQESGERILSIWRELKQVFEVLFAGIVNVFGPAIEQLFEILKGGLEWLLQFNLHLRELVRLGALLAAVFGFATGNPLLGTVAGSYFALDTLKALREGPTPAHAFSGNTSTRNQQNSFSINVHGATNDRELANEVERAVRKMIMDANDQSFLPAN